MRSYRFYAVLLAPLLLLALQGCSSKSENSSSQTSKSKQSQQAPEVTSAVAELGPASGSDVSGTVHFEKVADGVRVTADITGLTPGKHGFHIHEKGDCSAPDATSAGGHFNPTGAKHGGPNDAERHVGDLGNVEADSTGVGHYDRVDHVIKLNGEYSVVGLAVIVHSGEDDLVSQPTGDAGSRVACGKIVAQSQ